MTDRLRGALMVAGTASGAGKSVVVAALCRALARRGLRVAPFKAQNMSNNAGVTADGAEIGRAQLAQAFAAGVEAEAAMNPVLLKPLGDRDAQVVVLGRPAGVASAAAYGGRAGELFPVVLDCLDDLRRRFDVVVVEGAGGAAEPNLVERDIVNLRLADAAGVPAVVVGDIDRGGVFASLYGTLALLPGDQRRWVRGFVVNKFRGDLDVLGPGLDDLEARTGLPVAGVLPWMPGLHLDEEDSLSLERPDAPSEQPAALDVAVVRFPRIANFTDFDPLLAEPGVAVRFVASAAALGRPDLVVLPGTRHTAGDLDWLLATGLVPALAASGAEVLGICGGYQMLGRVVDDTVESGRGRVAGLGLLDVATRFEAEKLVRRRCGRVDGHPVTGYEIRHGRPHLLDGAQPWIDLDDAHGRQPEGCVGRDGRVRGTSLHGLFEADGFRRAFLTGLAARRGRTLRPGPLGFAERRDRHYDALAELVEAHLDWTRLERWIAEGAPVVVAS